MKKLLTFLFLTVGFIVKAQIKTEPLTYSYGKGGMNITYKLTANLCQYLYCNTQAKKLGNSEDLTALNNATADNSKWQRIRWWDLATYDSTNITYTTASLKMLLTSSDGIHYKGGAYLLGSRHKANVVKGSIISENQNGTSSCRFVDNISGQFVGIGCTGTIIYKRNDSIVITTTTTTTTTTNYWIVSFQEQYYDVPEAKIEFDVPYGYWAWFLNSDIPGFSGKIGILNPGYPIFELLKDSRVFTNQSNFTIK